MRAQVLGFMYVCVTVSVRLFVYISVCPAVSVSLSKNTTGGEWLLWTVDQFAADVSCKMHSSTPFIVDFVMHKTNLTFSDRIPLNISILVAISYDRIFQ